jgi:hypothetical protein
MVQHLLILGLRLFQVFYPHSILWRFTKHGANVAKDTHTCISSQKISQVPLKDIDPDQNDHDSSIKGTIDTGTLLEDHINRTSGTTISRLNNRG